MSYRIGFARSVKGDLRRLQRSVQQRTIERIEALENDPLPRDAEKLSGHSNLYRIRAGDWRIIYAIYSDRGEINILRVRHRREVYRNL